MQLGGGSGEAHGQEEEGVGQGSPRGKICSVCRQEHGHQQLSGIAQ